MGDTGDLGSVLASLWAIATLLPTLAVGVPSRTSRLCFATRMSAANSLGASVDRLPFWVWVGGVALFGGIAVFFLVASISPGAGVIGAAAVLYGIGLGRALLRRDLVRQGVLPEEPQRSVRANLIASVRARPERRPLVFEGD